MPKPRKERRFRAYLWGDRRLGGSADRQVADLVDDQQPRHGVDLEPFVEPVLTQRSDHARGGGEEHAVAPLDRFETQSDGEVGFADAGWNSHILRSFSVPSSSTIAGT